MRIEIHSKTMCPFCHHAKEYLKTNDIPFTEFVYDDDDERNEMYDRLGLEGYERTVPQIFAVENNGIVNRVGGYYDLIKSDVAARCNVGKFDVEF